ncbi:hypothetical protein LIER_27290 [Lithospermum erythrorhizon]|uniref:Peptidase C1A papain C-terminal domain-containing protein n=1 Tax=Lithospermum erythrorhizon TaxID=34254 RepID=A0AAV3RFK1_LITER
MKMTRMTRKKNAAENKVEDQTQKEESKKRPARKAAEKKVEVPETRKRPRRLETTTATTVKKRSRIGLSQSRPPMPKSEYKYPDKMPAKLPPQKRDIRKLYPPRPPPLVDLDPEKFRFSIKSDLMDEEAWDQLSFDTCWALAVMQVVQNNAKLDDQIKLDDWILSAQCLINCLPAIYNRNHLKKWFAKDECYVCNTEDALHLVKYRGMALASEVPYKGSYDGFQPYRSAGFIKDYNIIPLRWPDLVMGSILERKGFLIGTFDCDDDFENYVPGTVYDITPGKQIGGHCALITGVGKMNGESYFEIRNTFGPKWGKNGYGFINRKLFRVIQGVSKASIMDLESYKKSEIFNKDFVTLLD